MKIPTLNLKNTNRRTRELWLSIIAAGVYLTGLLTILSVLFAQARLQNEVVASDAHITIVIGLTFIYLASLLKRGKRTALHIALPLYIYIVIRNFKHFVFDLPTQIHDPLGITLNLLIPTLSLVGLVLARKLFIVRSELANFAFAIRNAALILIIAMLYGIFGFQLLDVRDFHQEITIASSAHYTIDQFGLTTDRQLEPHSRRAHLFLDSLWVVSLGSFAYAVVALFSPIKFRLSEHHGRQRMQDLLDDHSKDSEDFFKLWPIDKAYFFNSAADAGLAYKVKSGVALVVGDPIGKPKSIGQLLVEFDNYCHINDWEIALIHSAKSSKIYKSLGLEAQKIGEEAVVDIAHFQSQVVKNKYFRHIQNKFTKLGYSCEVLKPPHNEAVIKRLRQISHDWAQAPGRSERGFMMGYFSAAYMQQCNIMVVRDAAATVQAFINQIPTFGGAEADFDFLRSSRDDTGNINDFLMINFIAYLSEEGYKKLNLGLCPLSGLDNQAESSTINSALSFVYSNGDRFYSFSGLKRFKSKYEPSWRTRYIYYRGGIRGFGKALNALVRAMRA